MRAQLRTVVVVLVVVGDIILCQSNTQKYHRQSPRISLAHLARARRTPPINLVARALKTLMRSIARDRRNARGAMSKLTLRRVRMRTSTVGSCSSSADMAAVVVARRERARARRASGEVGRVTSGGVTQLWSLSLRARAQRTKKDGLILLWIDATG